MEAPPPPRSLVAILLGWLTGSLVAATWTFLLLLAASMRRCPYPQDCPPYRWSDFAPALALIALAGLLFGLATRALWRWRAGRRSGQSERLPLWAAIIFVPVALPTLSAAYMVASMYFDR